MAPLPPASERPLLATGARRRVAEVPRPTELVTTLRRLGAEGKELVALFDADAIAGERHLLSAWAHLGRSRGRGTERLRDRSAELALFVAGEDQLPRALAKVGVGPSTDRFVVVTERPRSLPPLLEAFGLVEEPSAYPRSPTRAMLARLGITAEDLSAVPESAWEGLVLERVALVDFGAAHGERPGRKS
ncbi:MAG TPA: KEOPS complex subunit Cgi121 [Thermoplasmata archaeon]|nr:KEOPS complex subunit Cgi121 [Thermoplasmata archaeon]